MADDAPQFRYRDPAPGFFHGLRAAFAGLGLSLRRGPVRRLYFRMMVVVSLTCIAFQAAGVWGVLNYWPSDVETTTLTTIGHVLAEIVAIVIVIMAAPLLALLLVSIALPVLAESLFLAALDTRQPAVADALRSGKGLSIPVSVANNVRRTMRVLFGTAISFALSLIPFAGAILGPAMQLYVTSRALSWELLDPWFDLNRMSYNEQKHFIESHRSLCLGFGGPYSVMMAVPILGPMTFGIAQSGAALLVADALIEVERK